MNQFKPTKYHLISYGVIILALISYIILRATKVDITNDEAYTFYNVTTFWIVEVFCTGNTHWLIFSFIKLLNLIGFEHIFALRLMSVLAGIWVYILLYKYYISKYSPLIVFVAFCLLGLNPYLIDYFGLARGYASGLLFQFFALICLHQIIYSENKKWIYLFFISSTLSVISNFNFFYFFVASMAAYLIFSVSKHGFEFFKSKDFKWWLGLSITCSLVTIKALQIITVCSNDIGNYGGNDFMKSIFSSQFLGLYNYHELINSMVITLVSYALFLTILTLAIISFFHKNKRSVTNYLHLLSIIIFMMLALSLFNYYVLDVLYPIDRTATIYYFPFCLLIIHCFASFHFKSYVKKMIGVTVIVLGVVNFLMSMNFSKTIDFPEQENSEKCFQSLDKINAHKVGLTKELFGVYRNYYQKTNHYNYHFDGYALNANEYYDSRFNNICLNEFDYIVLIPPYKITHCVNTKIKLSTVKYFKKSGLIILKVN